MPDEMYNLQFHQFADLVECRLPGDLEHLHHIPDSDELIPVQMFHDIHLPVRESYLSFCGWMNTNQFIVGYS